MSTNLGHALSDTVTKPSNVRTPRSSSLLVPRRSLRSSSANIATRCSPCASRKRKRLARGMKQCMTTNVTISQARARPPRNSPSSQHRRGSIVCCMSNPCARCTSDAAKPARTNNARASVKRASKRSRRNGRNTRTRAFAASATTPDRMLDG